MTFGPPCTYAYSNYISCILLFVRKIFPVSSNQNETSEDLHNTSTVPPSCFQRTNSNDSDVTMNDSYQVMLERLSLLNRNVSLSLPAFHLLILTTF